MSWPSVELLTTMMLHSGERSRKFANQSDRFLGVAIDTNHADVGIGLPHDIREKFVAGTFRFEPNDLHAEQHRLELLAGRVVGIDNR